MEQSKKDELIKDLDLYLQKFDCVNKSSRGNYISWTKYLMKTHRIEDIETREDVEKILHIEQGLQLLPDRKTYKTSKDLSNFRSTLNRILPFINMWRVKQKKLAVIQNYDDMISQIGLQACAEHAIMMFNAIVFRAFQEGYVMTTAQKQAMKNALAKFDCKIYADKLFMPESHCSINNPSAV